MPKISRPQFGNAKGKINRGLSAVRLQRSDYTVSIFGQVALAVAVMLYIFSLTYNPSNFIDFVVMFSILLSGIVLTIISVGIPSFIKFSSKSLYADAISTGTSVMAIYLVNKLVPFQGSTSPINDTAFVTLSGVSEEWFFRMWLCAWIYKVTGQAWLAILVSSAVWAIFHTARYGAQPPLMLVVFLAGLPLGAVTILFRSSDGPSFAHMLMNALASR